MESRALGRSGIEVTRVILGCGNFGGIGSAPEFYGKGESEEEAFAIMDAAWELGIRCFDTADAYGGGRSETAIGRWLRARGVRRDELVLSTKVFNPMEAGGDRGLAPARVRRQLESSLRRLGVGHVDLYLTHDWDEQTPVEDTLGELDALAREGLVRAVGASNVDAPRLAGALAASGELGLVRFEWVQNSYSLLDRGPEVDLLPLCASHGLGFTPFSPLAGGWLTGKYRRGEELPPGSRMTMRPDPYAHLRHDRVFDGLDRLEEAAQARGVDSATLALAWVLARPEVTAIVVGPRRPEHLEPARRALELELAADEAAALAALFPALTPTAGRGRVV
jgi:aryl-alcohol dehydrogenase-like predicted oxidoreductase